MIYCEQCGKVTGDGPEGSSWICEDCHVGKPSDQHKDDNDPHRAD